MPRITDARIAELVIQYSEGLSLDEGEELIWLLHDKIKELNALNRYKPLTALIDTKKTKDREVEG